MPARSDIDPADIPALLPYVMLIEKAGNQFLYRLVGSGVVREVGHDATGTYVGSYLSVPEQAEEAQAVFARVFVLAKPVFASGEFILKSGASLALSLLSLPLSDDGTAANMTIATLVSRFNTWLLSSRGWLAGLPIKVWNVIDVEDAGQLAKLCLEWEQSSAPAA